MPAAPPACGGGRPWKSGACRRYREAARPPWRQPRGKWMVSLVNSHTNATSKRWHLWEIDLRFALNSTPGWRQSRPRRPSSRRDLVQLSSRRDLVRPLSSRRDVVRLSSRRVLVRLTLGEFLSDCGKAQNCGEEMNSLREAGPPNHHDDKEDSDQ